MKNKKNESAHLLWGTMKTETEVRFSDTDMLGVVWHGNFLDYLEFARFIWVDKVKNFLADLLPHDCKFIVTDITVKYIKPAKFRDALLIETTLQDINRVQFAFKQNVYKNEIILIKSEVKISALDKENRIVIIPKKKIDDLKSMKKIEDI